MRWGSENRRSAGNTQPTWQAFDDVECTAVGHKHVFNHQAPQMRPEHLAWLHPPEAAPLGTSLREVDYLWLSNIEQGENLPGSCRKSSQKRCTRQAR